MPSASEKGHEKNVANLSKLFEICKGFGTKYSSFLSFSSDLKF